MLGVLLLMPLIAAALLALVRPRAWLECIHALAALGGLAAGLIVAARVWQGDVPVAIGGLLRADGLSALMVVVITLLGAIAALYGLGYIRAEYDDTHLTRVRSFFGLFHLFLFTMLLAVTTDNLGIMWVAIEGKIGRAHV